MLIVLTADMLGLCTSSCEITDSSSFANISCILWSALSSERCVNDEPQSSKSVVLSIFKRPMKPRLLPPLPLRGVKHIAGFILETTYFPARKSEIMMIYILLYKSFIYYIIYNTIMAGRSPAIYSPPYVYTINNSIFL